MEGLLAIGLTGTSELGSPSPRLGSRKEVLSEKEFFFFND